MHERLKKIREHNNLNQSEFAKLLGLGQSTLAMLEVGKRDILDRHIKTVCSIFNVNESWFRTGEGSMFVETDESILSELSTKYKLDPLDMKIVQSYLNLDTEQRSFIKDYVVALANSINEDSKDELSVEDQKEIDEEVEAYRQKLVGTKNVESVS